MVRTAHTVSSTAYYVVAKIGQEMPYVGLMIVSVQ